MISLAPKPPNLSQDPRNLPAWLREMEQRETATSRPACPDFGVACRWSPPRRPAATCLAAMMKLPRPLQLHIPGGQITYL